MSLWLVIALLGLLKLPLAGLMLWLPFHHDEAMALAPPAPDAPEEDGGSRALPAGPCDPIRACRRPAGPGEARTAARLLPHHAFAAR